MWFDDGFDCGALVCGGESSSQVTEEVKPNTFFTRSNETGLAEDNRNDDSSGGKKGKKFRFLGGRRSRSSKNVLKSDGKDLSQTNKKKGWFTRKRDGKSAAVEGVDDEVRSIKSMKSTTSSRSMLSTKRKAYIEAEQRRVVYRSFGPNPKELLAVEMEEKTLVPERPDHVIIKVQASTVSLEDCILRRGFCDDITSPVSLPVSPGMDVVGHIVVCGSEVFSFKRGARVAALVRTGGNARYISVPARSLVNVPKSLDAAEAVAMVSTYAAAYQSLKLVSDNNTVFSMQGKKVLIVGGMQGVGQALIQLCTKARAEVFATAPDRRHAYIRNSLGATPLPESSGAWSIMASGEMDFVFDGVCEDGLASATKALAPNGRLVCFGQSAVLREEVGMFGTPFSVRYNKIKSSMVSGGRTLDLWASFKSDPSAYKKNLQALFQLLKWKKIQPSIVKRVTLTEVAAVHERLEQGDVRGTVVCYPGKRKRVPGSSSSATKKTPNDDGDDAERE